MKQFSLVAQIPCNLDIEKLLEENPPSFNFHIDNFRHIINLITEIPAIKKDALTESGYVPISSTILKKHIDGYRKYLDYLLSQEVFETDNQFKVGKKCIGYRFTEKFRCINNVEEIKKKSLIRLAKITRREQFDVEKKYPELKRFFNADLQIDWESAKDWLHEQLKANKEMNAIMKFNSRLRSVEKLRNHEFFFIVDGSGNRLHTNLTHIKKELRNFITYGGARLVAIDLKNSQPFLSCILLEADFYKMDAYELFNAIHTNFLNVYDSNESTICNPYCINIVKKTKEIYSINNFHLYIMLGEFNERASNNLEKFISKVQQGNLYDFMREEVERRTGTLYDRSKIKLEILKAFYSDNRFNGQFKKIFRESFPVPFEVFKKIKSSGKEILSCLLQKIESTIFLDCISKRLASENGDLPIFTIHDSIVCPIGYQDYVKRVMEEEIFRYTKMHPKLEFEFWNPNNIY